MKNLFAKKTIKILMGVFFSVFVFSVFNFTAVVATHIPYQWDDNLSAKENFKRAGHPEVYKEFLNEITNKNQNGKDAEATKLPEVYIPDWLKKDIEKTLKEKGYLSDEERAKEIQKILQDNKTYLNMNGGKLTYTLLQPLPTESGKPLSENVTLKQYLTWAYKFVLALTGFLAVMMIVIGGVEYVISGANESMRGEAHKRIWGAITGLVLALVAYLVLYTINPSLVNFEDNWFFKPRSGQVQNDKTTQKNNNINQGVQKMKDLKFDEKGI